MDQLHEELKEQTPPPPDILLKHNTGKYLKYKDNMAALFGNNMQQHKSDDNDDEDRSQCSSQSEAEYETCDSGVSEQSSLSDEASTFPLSPRRTLRSASSPVVSSSPHQRQNTASSAGASGNRFMSGADGGESSKSATDKGSNSNDSSSTNTVKQAPHRSIISDVFDGKLLSSVQCLTCDRVSTREETFQDLSLPIPGKDHLTVLHQNQGLTSHQQHIVPPPPPLPAVTSPGLQQSINCTDAVSSYCMSFKVVKLTYGLLQVYQATPEGWFWWLVTWVRSFFWGPAVSLHDCMAAFFSADELKGDNMYR